MFSLGLLAQLSDTTVTVYITISKNIVMCSSCFVAGLLFDHIHSQKEFLSYLGGKYGSLPDFDIPVDTDFLKTHQWFKLNQMVCPNFLHVKIPFLWYSFTFVLMVIKQLKLEFRYESSSE
jgi:hypothetical protein